MHDTAFELKKTRKKCTRKNIFFKTKEGEIVKINYEM